MRKLFILLSLLPLAAIAAPSEDGVEKCGDDHQHHMKHKKSGDVPFYLRGLDMTDTQKAQIKAMMEKRHTDRKDGKAAYWENKKAIYALTHSETLDEAELEKRVDESLLMKKERAMERARFHHEMFNVLTPEQQEQLKAKMAELQKKHQH